MTSIKVTLSNEALNQLYILIFNNILEFPLAGIIAELFLTIFTSPKINLIDQLISLAKLAFMLLYIYRRNKNHFITKDLYCDIQSTIKDAFVCTAKYQKKETDIPLYLYQLGTDQLELLFGHVRTISDASNCDFLELKQRLVIAFQIAKVYKYHPD